MKKRLINHGIAIIGIAVLAFLAIASASVPATIRDDYKEPQNKDWDEAVAVFTDSINKGPSATAYNARGVAYYYKGQYNLAIADFEAALRLDSSNGNARDNLAKARQKAPSPVQVASRPAQTAPSPTQSAPAPAPSPAPAAPAPAIPAAQGNNLTEKFAWLQIFAQSNNSYLLEVNTDESISSQNLFYSGKDNITLTLRGVGANRRISGNFEIRSGVTLILDNNITLRSGITVRSGGTLIMNTGSALNGNGVFMDRGTFTMNGGTISGSQNSGVRSSGTFIMNDGTISGNTAGDSRKGVGGVLVSDGTFTMNGGTISGNTGGGVLVDYYFDDSISRGGTFIMNGGTISGNTTGENGGGVYVEWGISGKGIFTMSGGTISGNTAGNSGGGVYNRGIFTMSNGTISGNTAAGSGGGICTPGGGTFTKTGGTITGYTSDQRNGNAVKNRSGAVQNYRGHAVWAGSSNALLKIREGTAGPGDNLSYDGTRNPGTASGAWDN